MIGVAVMGCGVVGYGVVEMLIKNKEAVRRAARQEVRPLYMLDVRDMAAPDGVTLTHDFNDILADPAVSVVVETIGGSRAAYDFTRRALESGRHVVTSNKELVAAKGDELVEIAAAHHARYLYEASVGGGIPVLHPLMRCLQGNRITAVDGVVNGSTNYLLTQMKEKGVSFPAALGEAKRLGYVEADPAADVEGWDARRKLAILANACFGSRFGDEAFIPTVGISGVTEDDMAAAAAFGGAVRLIAHAQLCEDGKRWTGWVHPAFVPAAHPLYNVSDVFNAIIAHGSHVGDVMFYGRGAGREPTASAVVSDIIEIALTGGSIDAMKWDAAPVFDAEADGACRRLTRCGEGAEPILAACAPGWEVRPCGEQLALMTSPLADAEYDAAANALAARGVALSPALYALEQA
ncbi:MAG: homoserine dehydrogenase [Clostridia bacterium]|nr:homoserine dehydrogenase [Clostridia bacterium]